MGFINFDVETDLLYLEGFEEGFKNGFKKGLKIGLNKAIQIRTINVIRRMTAAKMENSLIADCVGEELFFVKSIQNDLLQKEKITELLKKQETAEVIAKKLKVNALLVDAFKYEITSD